MGEATTETARSEGARTDGATTDGTAARRSYGQPCPVAHSLDLVGERWTLLIVRDLVFGPLRFTELLDGLPGLSRNLLAERLAMLVGRGILEKVNDPVPGSRSSYALTERGWELAPVIHALARFGVPEWDDPSANPPPPRLLRGAILALMAPEALDGSAWRAELVLGDSKIWLEVNRPEVGREPLTRLHLANEPPSEPADLRLESDLTTLRDLRNGSVDPADAENSDRLRIEGDPTAAAQLRSLLGFG